MNFEGDPELVRNFRTQINEIATFTAHRLNTLREQYATRIQCLDSSYIADNILNHRPATFDGLSLNSKYNLCDSSQHNPYLIQNQVSFNALRAGRPPVAPKSCYNVANEVINAHGNDSTVMSMQDNYEDNVLHEEMPNNFSISHDSCGSPPNQKAAVINKRSFSTNYRGSTPGFGNVSSIGGTPPAASNVEIPSFFSKQSLEGKNIERQNALKSTSPRRWSQSEKITMINTENNNASDIYLPSDDQDSFLECPKVGEHEAVVPGWAKIDCDAVENKANTTIEKPKKMVTVSSTPQLSTAEQMHAMLLEQAALREKKNVGKKNGESKKKGSHTKQSVGDSIKKLPISTSSTARRNAGPPPSASVNLQKDKKPVKKTKKGKDYAVSESDNDSLLASGSQTARTATASRVATKKNTVHIGRQMARTNSVRTLTDTCGSEPASISRIAQASLYRTTPSSNNLRTALQPAVKPAWQQALDRQRKAAEDVLLAKQDKAAQRLARIKAATSGGNVPIPTTIATSSVILQKKTKKPETVVMSKSKTQHKKETLTRSSSQVEKGVLLKNVPERAVPIYVAHQAMPKQLSRRSFSVSPPSSKVRELYVQRSVTPPPKNVYREPTVSPTVSASIVHPTLQQNALVRQGVSYTCISGTPGQVNCNASPIVHHYSGQGYNVSQTVPAYVIQNTSAVAKGTELAYKAKHVAEPVVSMAPKHYHITNVGKSNNVRCISPISRLPVASMQPQTSPRYPTPPCGTPQTINQASAHPTIHKTQPPQVNFVSSCGPPQCVYGTPQKVAPTTEASNCSQKKIKTPINGTPVRRQECDVVHANANTPISEALVVAPKSPIQRTLEGVRNVTQAVEGVAKPVLEAGKQALDQIVVKATEAVKVAADILVSPRNQIPLSPRMVQSVIKTVADALKSPVMQTIQNCLSPRQLAFQTLSAALSNQQKAIPALPSFGFSEKKNNEGVECMGGNKGHLVPHEPAEARGASLGPRESDGWYSLAGRIDEDNEATSTIPSQFENKPATQQVVIQPVDNSKALPSSQSILLTKVPSAKEIVPEIIAPSKTPIANKVVCLNVANVQNTPVSTPVGIQYSTPANVTIGNQKTPYYGWSTCKSGPSTPTSTPGKNFFVHNRKNLKAIAPPAAEDQWQMSDEEDANHDEEDPDNMRRRRRNKKIPAWCRDRAAIINLWHQQRDIDPDTIFGIRVRSVVVDEVFPPSLVEKYGETNTMSRAQETKRAPRKSRNWEVDGLRFEEVDAYKSAMGFTRDLSHLVV